MSPNHNKSSVRTIQIDKQGGGCPGCHCAIFSQTLGSSCGLILCQIFMVKIWLLPVERSTIILTSCLPSSVLPQDDHLPVER